MVKYSGCGLQDHVSVRGWALTRVEGGAGSQMSAFPSVHSFRPRALPLVLGTLSSSLPLTRVDRAADHYWKK